MKKIIIGLYIAGAILTNSYIRVHRVEEWIDADIKAYKSDGATLSNGDMRELRAANYAATVVTSILWPIYITFIGSDTLVSTKVSVEAPEIFK